MDIRTKFILAVLAEMTKFLDTHFVDYNLAPKAIADEIENIANRVKKSTDAMKIRHYLLDIIASTSSFWRAIAPYTYYNKLITHLETVANSEEFTVHSIHMAQITELHEHYLIKQKELIQPLQIEIYRLQKTCEALEKTIKSLREENTRLRKENDFFLKELESLHEKITAEKENKIQESKTKTKSVTVKAVNASSEPHNKLQPPIMN